MDKSLYIALLLLLTGLFSVSCSSSSTASLSSTAQVTSMRLAAQDSFPGFAAASFVVDERIDTGWIYNKDSIAYGTPLERTAPRFAFASTPKWATIATPDTTVTLNGSDTLDMSKGPMYLTVRSADDKHTKVYQLFLYIHQVDPDLFVWKQKTAAIVSGTQAEQKAVLLDDEFCFYRNDGFGVSLYTSDDGETWTQARVSGLPASCRVRNIVSWNNSALFYADGGEVYYSADGSNWQAMGYVPSEVSIQATLCCMANKIWAVGTIDEELVLCYFDQSAWGEEYVKLPADFPTSDFACTTFTNLSQRERALVAGGYSKDGEKVNGHYGIEYSPLIEAPAHIRWKNYCSNFDCDTVSGAVMVYYEDRLYRIGGFNGDNAYLPTSVYISMDEGIHWIPADTSKIEVAVKLQNRQRISATVRDNGIYIFGGQDDSQCYSDVYFGKINSADWADDASIVPQP